MSGSQIAFLVAIIVVFLGVAALALHVFRSSMWSERWVRRPPAPPS